MKEIKFRAWGKNIKEFLSPNGNIFGLTLKEIQNIKEFLSPNGNIFGLTLKEIQNIEDIDLWEFQQYTGLKDKNGKEIYEGDVVEWKYFKEIIRKEVLFEEGMFCLYIENTHCQLCEFIPMGLEVIGNIYEHSHLLDE